MTGRDESEAWYAQRERWCHPQRPRRFSHALEVIAMCEHRNGDPEDCVLALATSGRLVCVQHPAPIPRQRDDDLDLRVAEMQRDARA